MQKSYDLYTKQNYTLKQICDYFEHNYKDLSQLSSSQVDQASAFFDGLITS